MTRFRLLGVIGCVALAVVVAARVRAAIDTPRLTWVATARQMGPVSYRDPAGAISPDGRWVAYSEGRFLRVRPVGGGAGIDFSPNAAQIRTLAWSPDSSTIAADGFTAPSTWALYRVQDGRAEALARTPGFAEPGLRQFSWSPDGKRLAAVASGANGDELRLIPFAGSDAVVKPLAGRIAFPAWTPSGDVACIATVNGRSRVSLPCGGPTLAAHPNADAFGPLAFSIDGASVYAGIANGRGTVDLWSIPVGRSHGVAQQLTSFSRDSYAPSVAADGSVTFKVQSYRTHVAYAPAQGGVTAALATFPSETPSWDPTGRFLGITYGTWRRLPDDARYPDIAQDAGIIAVDPSHPATAPASVVHDSPSEDQSLCWSPNGKWIAFHSHKDMSDDIWLRPAFAPGRSGATAGKPADAMVRRITMLGRGAEAGWPRWSPDGRWLLFTGASRSTRRTVMYVVGISQDNGEIIEPTREIPLAGLTLDVFHGEWTDAGDSIVAVGKEGPGRHVIFTVARSGGEPSVVHRFASEHDVPGLGVSPDGKHAAFIAPAADGFFQVFRIPLSGGLPAQVTSDPSNKTQPAWSPDGQRIAFTVWNYEAQFWRLDR